MMKPLQMNSEDRAVYNASVNDLATASHCERHSQATDNDTIAKAIGILHTRLVVKGEAMTAPQVVKAYLTLKMGALGHEVFACLFLDAQNRLIAYEELFRGTLTQTSVYPREVIKTALQYNAASVIFAHNHPSGISEPSRADELLTTTLKTALAMVDVKVLDHIVVAGVATVSFAERGMI